MKLIHPFLTKKVIRHIFTKQRVPRHLIIFWSSEHMITLLWRKTCPTPCIPGWQLLTPWPDWSEGRYFCTRISQQTGAVGWQGYNSLFSLHFLSLSSEDNLLFCGVDIILSSSSSALLPCPLPTISVPHNTALHKLCRPVFYILYSINHLSQLTFKISEEFSTSSPLVIVSN